MFIYRNDLGIRTGCQYRIMFYRTGNDMAKIAQNQIIGLCPATGKNNIMYRYIQRGCQLASGIIQPGTCHPAKMMNRRRIGRDIGQTRHRLCCLRQQRGGRIIIQIDRHHTGYLLSHRSIDNSYLEAVSCLACSASSSLAGALTCASPPDSAFSRIRKVSSSANRAATVRLCASSAGRLFTP